MVHVISVEAKRLIMVGENVGKSDDSHGILVYEGFKRGMNSSLTRDCKPSPSRYSLRKTVSNWASVFHAIFRTQLHPRDWWFANSLEEWSGTSIPLSVSSWLLELLELVLLETHTA